MGFSGDFLVVRSERALVEHSAASGGRVERVWEGEGGWQLAQGEFEGAGVTDGPALLVHVIDGDVAVVEVLGPVAGAWSCVLDQDLALDYGFPEERLQEPAAVAAKAAAWAGGLGLAPDGEHLAEVLGAAADEGVEELFFELLEALGIPLDIPEE
ncbi:hypothetical protein CFP65_1417 [Kitasatospora sp. MMS16-BH015]|uniref:hypothetical protein n=1 Tax=Kitasatospora sp. MMS16-BH015 TaxID=2018025 RepID=UPI000CA24047|nr:hypothetical protein [Kitasatospora sp. MMS16-BH015]AUG76316.1 hypothetical protein CFP65_1417 [Kitasatospora sp. MMS16-BH015]